MEIRVEVDVQIPPEPFWAVGELWKDFSRRETKVQLFDCRECYSVSGDDGQNMSLEHSYELRD